MAAISGRYRGRFSGGEAEVRVEVGGERECVSGDVFEVSGATSSLLYSFIAEAPRVSRGDGETVIEGLARFSAAINANMVRVTVRHPPVEPGPPVATVQLLRTDGTVGQAVSCTFESRFLRTVEIKEDVEQQVSRFIDYQTDSLQSPGPARVLSIAKAFEEAGIEILPAPEPAAPSLRAPGGSWSNAELHDAMKTSFQGLEEKPAWKLWILHAEKYEEDQEGLEGQETLGMMFDVQGKQRQGCAVFYNDSLAGQSHSRRRDQLHTCVHEIGHCFNLRDAFVGSDLIPARPGALSWMNYPWEFLPVGRLGGRTAYWEAFTFQFDAHELLHLKHGFRNNVIMGGRPFQGEGALRRPELFRDPDEDASGLGLRLEAPAILYLGEPVWVELRLALRGGEPREVHTCLHPSEGFVQIAIRKPGSEAVLFEPLVRRCRQLQTFMLDGEAPSLYETAYLGFGKGGFYFSQAGLYEIRAIYKALDGSRVVSNTLRLRIRSPLSHEDDSMADAYLGEEQGLLLAFRGSDSDHLSQGNKTLRRVIEEHSSHPLASYARMVQANNLSREFKRVLPDGEVHTRPVQPKTAEELLKPVAEDFLSGRSRINNMVFGRTFRKLAQAQLNVGDSKGAKSTLARLRQHLVEGRAKDEEQPSFKPHVLRAIDRQAKAVLAQGLNRSA